MVLESFYVTASQLCFTLLGLWWVVIQSRYDVWTRSPQRRRIATNISLYFLFPGAMSLLALISVEMVSFWRLAFLVASALGLYETARLVARSDSGSRSGMVRLWRWAALPLYALIFVVALVPTLPLLFGIEPLAVAAISLALIILLGANLAWDYFIEPPPEE
jgi:hypothetical protein